MEKNRPFWKPITFKEWLNTEEFKRGIELDSKTFIEMWFNRMPIRRAYQKRNWVYASFDGIVTHIGKYKSNEDVFDVKGKSYTVDDVLATKMECDCYACGIYLTTFSVHLGRFPVTGILRKIEELPPILTSNASMIDAEANLFKHKINPEDFNFSYKNQRSLYEIYDTYNKMDVIVVSIADRDVDSLLDFRLEGSPCRQGQRMQFVCWGSYSLIVIPERKHFELKPLVKPFDYVYAGLNPVFEVRRIA